MSPADKTLLVVMVLSLAAVFVGFFGEEIFLISKQTELTITWTLFVVAAVFVILTFVLERRHEQFKAQDHTSSG